VSIKTARPKRKRSAGSGYEWIGGFKEGAEYIGSSERQLRRWVQQGKVGHTRMGAAVRFSKEQLDAFVESTSFEVAS
jgi:excisionase family DNA binding protein